MDVDDLAQLIRVNHAKGAGACAETLIAAGWRYVPTEGPERVAMVERALEAIGEDFVCRRGTGHRAMDAALSAALTPGAE